MKTALAALVIALATPLAAASCFSHPDTGVMYCSSAAECPPNTTWSSATQACTPAFPTFACPTNQVWSVVERRCVGILPECNLVIRYEVHDPQAAVILRPIDYCPYMEVAISAALTRLLAP